MPQKLSIKEAQKLGVTFPCEQMENGERRFRCVDADGYGYALTKMPAQAGGWQNSHFHRDIIETYIVQEGWIVFAELGDGKARLHRLLPGEVVTTSPLVVHNLYLPGGAVVHTVKHGRCQTADDRYASPELDALVCHLGEAELLRLPHGGDA